MPKKIYFFLLFLCLNGCKLIDKVPPKGSVYIQVTDQFGRTVPGATITGDPVLPNVLTDNFGTVLVKDVSVTTYEIIATKPDYGSGKAVILVKENEVVSVNIVLQYGVFSSFAPLVSIDFPVVPAEFSFGESIIFKGTVSDNDTPVENLEIRWESSIDGLLSTGKADEKGVVRFETTKLSRNTHFIYLTAKDKSGNVGRDSIIVSTLSPQPVTLENPTLQSGEVSLKWSASTAPDFKQYNIYRLTKDCDESTKLLVASLTNVGTTTWIDKAPPLEPKVCYTVEVVTNTNRSRRSNVVSVTSPAGPIFDFVAHDAVIHPTKPWMYLSDPRKGRLVVYDFGLKEIINEVTVPSLSGFILIGDNKNGLNVYVPCRDNKVHILDAGTLAVKKTLIAGAPATDVAIDGNGVVFVTVTNQWTNPISSFNERSGMFLSSWPHSCLYGGARLRKIPNQNLLMAISTQISPIDMTLIQYDEKGMLERCISDRQHGDYPLDPRIFRVAPLGNYVLTSENGAAYQCNEAMNYLGQIQGGGLRFSDFAFNSDGSRFYAATSNRNSIQIGRFPELTRLDELMTRGLPVKVFVQNNKLIALSRVDEFSESTTVELLTLP